MSNGRSFLCMFFLAIAAVSSFLLVLNLISYQAKLNDRILVLDNRATYLEGQAESIAESYCADVTFESDVYRHFAKIEKGIDQIKSALQKQHKPKNDTHFKD